MYLDDIKLFSKNEKKKKKKKKNGDLDTVCKIYQQDIGMEFGIKKSAILIMKSR